MATSRKSVGAKISTAQKRQRPNLDFYATPVEDIEKMLKTIFATSVDNEHIKPLVLDPCAGNGAFKKAIKSVFPHWSVMQWDIVERNEKLDYVGDFLAREPHGEQFSMVMMNPPFGDSMEFIQHAFKFLKPGGVVVAFLKLDFLASKKRYNGLFKDGNSLLQVWVNVSRVNCKYDGDGNDKQSSTTDSGWFIFQQGMPVVPQIQWLE